MQKTKQKNPKITKIKTKKKHTKNKTTKQINKTEIFTEWLYRKSTFFEN